MRDGIINMGCVLSIIIPVYGVEKYLSRCLDILVAQERSLENMWGHIEIILVDDGSIDKSPQICDEYVKRNKILKVIHKRNAGLASARNTGLEIAKGKWVTFIDSDDTVATDYLLEILKMIKKYSEADCILFGIMLKNAKDEKTYFYDNSYFCGEITDWLRIVEKRDC